MGYLKISVKSVKPVGHVFPSQVIIGFFLLVQGGLVIWDCFLIVCFELMLISVNIGKVIRETTTWNCLVPVGTSTV